MGLDFETHKRYSTRQMHRIICEIFYLPFVPVSFVLSVRVPLYLAGMFGGNLWLRALTTTSVTASVGAILMSST